MKSNIPKLICMIGISASGKSTIAKTLAGANSAVIISSDKIRGEICEGGVSDQSKNNEVFSIFHKRIKENLLIGNSVIADATNITMKSRRAILNYIKGIDCEIIAYIIPKRIEDCIRDNIDREHPVPVHVIHRQAMNFEIPFYEEGFDKIIINDINGFPNINPIEKMFGFDQKNPHHNDTLDVHCNKVAERFSKVYNDNALLYAAFLHDVGKTMCQTFDENGIAHYYQHQNIGAYYVLTNLRHLSYGYRILDICFLINYHMMPFTWNTDKTHNKYKKIFGEEKYQMLVDFNKCDIERTIK